MRRSKRWFGFSLFLTCVIFQAFGNEFSPLGATQTQREEVFQFTQKPQVRYLGNDKYELTFAVKGFCDVTVAVIGKDGTIIRHLASGVLGTNAPEPFQKKSLTQKLYWNGQDDLGAYVKNPETMSIKVALGLNPAFDRVLGWHSHLPAGCSMLGLDEKNLYVMTQGRLRKYDRDGNYQKTVFPPAADVPMEKLKGLEALEVEKGKWAVHSYVGHRAPNHGKYISSDFKSSVSGFGEFWPGGTTQQISVSDGWFIFATSSFRNGGQPVWLHRINTADGTSDEQGYAWRKLTRMILLGRSEFAESVVHTAVSPDKRWIYLSGMYKGLQSRHFSHAVFRLDTTKRTALSGKTFIGHENKAGRGEKQLNAPLGIACDARGRVIVCDHHNNRIQAFSGDGTFLKSIKLSRPYSIQAHRKDGSLYVIHLGSVKGQSRWQLIKLKSLEDPQIVAKLDLGADRTHWKPLLALDMWSSPARVWLTKPRGGLYGLRETENSFKAFRVFNDDVKKAGMQSGQMGARFSKVTADPNRELLYYYGAASSGGNTNAVRYDLATGKHRRVSFPSTGRDFGHDYAFDKRGKIYTHVLGKIYRHDPEGGKMIHVPFDYGTVGAQTGAIALKDQSGAKGFQDGIGVAMRGDVAVVSNIYYVPKFQDAAKDLSGDMHTGDGSGRHTGFSHASYQRHIMEVLRKGQQVYSVKRKPGIKLSGGTIWTFDSTGELRGENVIRGLGLTNGVQLDEDGAVYTVCNMPKMVGGRAFLAGKGRVLGSKGTKGMKSMHPFTGTFIKASVRGATIFSKAAPLKMESYPKRAPDLSNSGWGWDSTKDNGFVKGENGAWVEGAEWIYGGASPIVPSNCSCPNMRHATDWYKRSFIPEAYRHSVGVVDSAGNLIMHLGRYGNADSGRGSDSPVKIGGNEIAFLHVMYVTVTDTYLVASDIGNKRLVVMKLKYHAQESAKIQTK